MKEHEEGLREWVVEGGRKVDRVVRVIKSMESDLSSKIIDDAERC